MPNNVFWQQWWERWGMANCTNVSQALNDPWVLNRDDLPFKNLNLKMH